MRSSFVQLIKTHIKTPVKIVSGSSRRSLMRMTLGCLALAATFAALPQKAMALSDYERSILSAVEQSLNRIGTAQGRFMQVSAAGNIARGAIYISRPGKMRFEYDPPSPLMIVADGFWVMQVDKELENTATKRLSSTPLSFILAENVSFDNGVNVASMETVGESILITVFDARKPTDGTLTLIVDRSTFDLKAWQVVDKRGERTTVRLENMAYGVGLDSNLFVVPNEWKNN